MGLYKSVVVIWSEYEPRADELFALAREVASGEAYCSRMDCEFVTDPKSDMEWDGTEFFGE